MAAPRKWAAQATLNDDTPVELMPAVTGRQYFVTKVTLAITTHANAKHINVQDDAGTPVVITHHEDLTEAAGVPSQPTFDYGRRGLACTVSKGVDAVSETSGPDGFVYAEGYYI